MHDAVDLNWLLQIILTVFVLSLGLLHLVKNTASKYFVVDDDEASTSNAVFDSDSSSSESNTAGRRRMVQAAEGCVVCHNRTTKQCAGCKMVKYCSEVCQRRHWNLEHKMKCKTMQMQGKKASTYGSSVPAGGTRKTVNQTKEILFPYEEFVEIYNWDKPGFPPCGLLNCGNSCFANVVLQCLTYTRPLVAFLLEKGHRRECTMDGWCFLCQFQVHVERACQSSNPYSPLNILSHLPKLGATFGCGDQEDAHEFMRFAIDRMQSVCLDEFGGEKAVQPRSQETTLIQHIFGGQLQSQVICSKCNNVSNQFENMMDLTVEIQGDAASLEECLDQFTAKEELHGDNMYKCDGCNDYVTAWKRLSVRKPPNILTIALKRFQSGRFGKLNKTVTFPDVLDLRPYVSDPGDDNDVYKLYAVIVHVDMLNASFFGHYICYIKDFRGRWYRIDDCRVTRVNLDEVLSQGAYMLLYNRISVRGSPLYDPVESSRKEEEGTIKLAVQPSAEQTADCFSAERSSDTTLKSIIPLSGSNSETKDSSHEGVSSPMSVVLEEDTQMVKCVKSLDMAEDVELSDCTCSTEAEGTALVEQREQLLLENASVIGSKSIQANGFHSESCSSTPHVNGGMELALSKSSEDLSMNSSIKDLPNDSNHAHEEHGVASDASAFISNVKGPDKVNSPTLGLEIEESNGKIPNAGLRSNGVSHSGLKPKPLLTPGFLGKRTRERGNRSGDSSPKCGQQHSEGKLGGQDNGFVEPSVVSQNGTVMKDVEDASSKQSNIVLVECEPANHVGLSKGINGDAIPFDNCLDVN